MSRPTTSNGSDAGKGEKDKLWWKIKWDRWQFNFNTSLLSLLWYATATTVTSNDVIIRLRRGFRFLFWPVVCLLMICSVMFVSIHQQREYPITNICNSLSSLQSVKTKQATIHLRNSVTTQITDDSCGNTHAISEIIEYSISDVLII